MNELEGQVSIFDLDLPFGKTCPEPLAVTKEKISGRLSKQSQASVKTDWIFLDLRRANGNMRGGWQEMDGALLGGSTMLNTGVCPNVERESTLSQILQLNAPEKYFLSPQACAGIIRRAEKRGKTLPDMLRAALMEVVGLAGGLNSIEEEPEPEMDSIEEEYDE